MPQSRRLQQSAGKRRRHVVFRMRALTGASVDATFDITAVLGIR